MVSDETMMRRALFHAARAAGATTPNPMVGAVVVTPAGIVVGQGRHIRAGAPHAEVIALDEAGSRARGATLYVTLEPCCHHGRTPPCTDRVIASGVRRAVVAMADPNPLVDGRGLAALRAAGIRVDVGLLAEQAADLNQAFIAVHRAGRPQVVVKVAMSRDRKIAARPGERTAISGRDANRRSQRLRATADAVAVGVGTVLTDDPLLTVRETVRPRPLLRAIFDRALRTPPTARLFSTLDHGPVIILAGKDAATQAPDRARALERAGAVVTPAGDTIEAGVRSLLGWDVSMLVVEGGARVHRALFDADLVDVVHMIVAPVDLGAAGVPVFGGDPDPLAGRTPVVIDRLGPDTWMRFDVHRHH
jgi:diaminohydroxyphosphoribosylaminopyrimidine deaminase/5-amino-6-(5-phosphoribosylamino)uracil reductase